MTVKVLAFLCGVHREVGCLGLAVSVFSYSLRYCSFHRVEIKLQEVFVQQSLCLRQNTGRVTRVALLSGRKSKFQWFVDWVFTLNTEGQSFMQDGGWQTCVCVCVWSVRELNEGRNKSGLIQSDVCVDVGALQSSGCVCVHFADE